MKGIVIQGGSDIYVGNNTIIGADVAIEASGVRNATFEHNQIISKRQAYVSGLRSIHPSLKNVSEKQAINALHAVTNAKDKRKAFEETFVGKVSVAASGGIVSQVFAWLLRFAGS